MKRIYYAIVIACIAITTFNCQKEASFENPDFPGNTNTNPINATLQGNVLDENGDPAVGVTIKVGSKTVTTNARGYFRIVNAPLDKKASLVTAEKSGYFKAFRTFSATSGTNQVVIRLMKKTLAGTVSNAAGGSVSLSNGSKVEFPAGGIAKASGGSYSGTVNVYVSYIDPTSNTIGQTVPGSFLATDKDNNQVILKSFGMLAVELESPSGEKLQVASGKTAALTTAIPAALQAAAPATISLWFVDEKTGIWKEEGTATKNGSNYVGQVKHFTYWNCDIPGSTVNLTATFKDPHGLPLVHTEIVIRPVGGYASAHGYTDSLGQISGPIPANTNLVLEVMSPCYTPVYSQNIGPYTSNVALGTITVNNNTSIVSLQGRLLNCGGSPVTQGYAIINFDNIVRYANVQNANGEFSTTFFICGSSPSACEIIGVDQTTQQQGAAANVTVSTPLTNAGNITACGTSSLQFINYNVDGTNYSVSSTVIGDTFGGYSYDSAGNAGTYIYGYHGNNAAVSFGFNDNKTTGVYPITNLYLDAAGVYNIIPPFNVTLTNYPTLAGQFYEGSFTGQFKDVSNITHTVTCSFRVRRQ